MSKSFLVVDDAMCMRLKIRILLQRYLGIENIVEASDGFDAVNLYKRNKYDVVIMDITMPNMDGLTALKKIREVDPRAAVIMVTAIGKEASVVEAITAGARDYIVKPYDDQRVVATIQKVLQALG